MRTTIKKLVIELNEKDVELTMPQAKELYAALSELFQEKERVVSVPYPVRPYRWPWREPYWVCESGTRMRLSDSSVRLSVQS